MALNEAQRKRQIRVAATIIILSYLLWMGLNMIGRNAGWPNEIALLIDLGALAGFVWALVLVFGVWRSTRQHH